MNKAVFLDRDGTINIDKKYLFRKEEFEFAPGAIEALRILQEKRFLLIIITNQSGIARGYYTEEEFFGLNEWMLRQLERRKIKIEEIYYCPHHPNAVIPKYRMQCKCRKPETSLFWKAVQEYQIDLTQSYAIGDKLRDCAICMESKCNGILIGNSEERNIISDVRQGKYDRIQYQRSLMQGAMMIANMQY